MSIASLPSLDADALAQPITRAPLRISRLTIAVSAVVIAYADGFWVTSLHGAVGSVDSSQTPFVRWLRDSTMMLPALTLAVLAALVLTRCWVGQSRREAVQLASAALMMIVICSVVSTGEVTVNSVTDYGVQVAQLEASHSTHATTPVVDPGTVVVPSTGACTGLCSARHQTLMVHVRAVGYAAMILLITNAVLVIWVFALRGGRLWASP